MIRYRLRTLLIVLALGPPVLAGAWLLGPLLEMPLFFIVGTMWIWLPLVLLSYLAATKGLSEGGCLIVAVLEVLALVVSALALRSIARE